MDAPVKTLIIDIETSPNIADVWGLWQQNVSLSQLRESTRVICFAAKWHGDKKMIYFSEHHQSRAEMVAKAHTLLDEADAVVHYNGTTFDIPHLRREFLEGGLQPPSPFRQIDLCGVAKKVFRFPSNKLAYVSEQLGLSGKLSHTGHDLWRDCMNGDPKAWNLMRRYNIQDVRTTEELYDKLLPWIPSHPHVGLYSEDPSENVCSRCGGGALKKRGFAYTPLTKFQQYRCEDCGAWTRGKYALAAVELRGTNS